MTYLHPFPQGTRKSQNFGANPNNGVNPAGGHTGTDWAVDVGTPIRAAHDGIIRNSDWMSANYQDNPWWLTQMGGDTTVLDCVDEAGRSDTMPTFVYAHESDSTAPVGAFVRKGDIIAYSGNSGTASTGPHCHMEYLPPGWDFNNGTYGRRDPDEVLDEYWDGSAAAGPVTDHTQEDDIMAIDPNAKILSDVDGQPCSWNDWTQSIDRQLKAIGTVTAIDGSHVTFEQQIRSLDSKLTAALGEAAALRSVVATLAQNSTATSEQIEAAIKGALANFTVTLVAAK